MVIMNRQPPSS